MRPYFDLRKVTKSGAVTATVGKAPVDYLLLPFIPQHSDFPNKLAWMRLWLFSCKSL